MSLLNIVGYIKSSIEILMNMKLDETEYKLREEKYYPTSRPYFKRNDRVLKEAEKSCVSDYEPPKEYEIAIQKLEADARNHIRV